MLFDPNIDGHIEKALAYVRKLIGKGDLFEVKGKRIRSPEQNAYEHLLFQYFAVEYGETKSYVKQVIFKELVNPDIFLTTYTNPKTKEVREDIRSTADLTTGETTTAINRFKNYSAMEFGIVLPEAKDKRFIAHCMIEIERNKDFTYGK